MPYITREDGQHFVIPSYRDVLTVKQKSQLKKEMLLLSQNYGEYVTLQKKGTSQYEVAFSPDTGYLLGESIWHHFKKPLDMIYCEAIPNTTEAILVIVKSGSVYLDGSFPLDSIPEELIIFLTQQNNFEIYIYGDVPISQEPEAGKFSFEISSVKSFSILDKPIFTTLALLKIYQLQLVDVVLREQGIGVFPTKPLIILVMLAAAMWMGYAYFTAPKKDLVATKPQVNPYQQYIDLLKSAAPDQEVATFVNRLEILFQIPGWKIKDVKYTRNNINATVFSSGAKVEDLYAWAKDNKFNVQIKKTGIFLTQYIDVPSRSYPKNIYPVTQIIGTMVDRLASVYPGNNMQLGDFIKKGVYSNVLITVKFQKISTIVLSLIGKQFVDLPLVLHDITVSTDEENTLAGSITLDALGS